MEFSRKVALVNLSIYILLFCRSVPSQASPSPGRTNPYTSSGPSPSQSRTPITSNHVRDNQVIPEVTTFQNVSSPLSPSANQSIASCSDESVAAGRCSRPMGLDMKKLSLELIRHDILRKLRLDENKLPNVTAIPKEYLTSLLTGIEMQNDSPQSQYDDDHATTEKIIAFSRTQQIKMNGKSLSSHHFTFTDKLLNMRIDTAMLHILVKFHEGANQLLRKGEFYVRVMQLISEKRGESPVFNNYGPVKAIALPPHPGQTHFRHESSRWIQIDVRQVLGKWIANSPVTSSRKIGLVFDVTDASQNHISEVSIVSGSDLNVNQNPFLEVEVSEEGRSRHTRDLGLDCLESSKETRCCRYPLTVDFDVFGWDWVIAPKQYEANYCSGECPFAFLQKYPHNHIVQQVNRGIGGPCCTARKLSPITMLHFDQDGNIVFSVLPGMLVDQCGCS